MGYLHLPAHSCKSAFHSPSQRGPPVLVLTLSSLHGSWENMQSWKIQKRGRDTSGSLLFAETFKKPRQNHTHEPKQTVYEDLVPNEKVMNTL